MAFTIRLKSTASASKQFGWMLFIFKRLGENEERKFLVFPGLFSQSGKILPARESELKESVMHLGISAASKRVSYRLIHAIISCVIFCFIGVVSFGQQSTAAPADAKAGAGTVEKSTAQDSGSQAGSDASKPTLPPAVDKNGTPLYETIQEDWSSLAVGVSKLEPQKPLVASTDKQETFTRTLVQVQWRPGDPLDLWIIVPNGVKKPPVVLYLYGYDQDTGRFKDNRWATRVTSDGVAAVGFVSALTGHRFHDRPMKQWFVSELQEAVGSTVHDVKFILDYLAERGDLDMDRVGMFGEGTGGTIAILAAASDSRIKAVDTLEPWGDWPDFLTKSVLVQQDPEHAEYVKPEFLKKVAPLDPVKWLPQLKIPIRIQQVRQGDSTPMEVKESVKQAAPKQAEVVRFEAETDLGAREGGGRLFDWIKFRVQQVAKPEAGSGKASVADSKTVLPQEGANQSSHR